jgi:hypothetical protein
MRFCLCLCLSLAAAFAAETHGTDSLRGKLTVHPNGAATVETPDHRTIKIDGDDTEHKVLADPRLNGFEIEARGRFTAPDSFTLNPSHTHSLMVRKDGHLKLVSYWCNICSIRAYAPGPCVCCQRETELDLLDPDQH